MRFDGVYCDADHEGARQFRWRLEFGSEQVIRAAKLSDGHVPVGGIKPEEIAYDKFVFTADGTYNGMVRKGSFSAWSFDGSLISEGSYQCDNYNMKLEYTDSEGVDRKILAQVVSFTEDTIWLKYEDETHHVTVTFVIRKGQSSSSLTIK